MPINHTVFTFRDPAIFRSATGGGGGFCTPYTPGTATIVHTGDVVLNTQSDLDALGGVTRVVGNLTIQPSGPWTDLSNLELLAEVTGDLNYSVSVEPAEIPLTGLRFVGGNISLDASGFATSFDDLLFNLTLVTGDITINGASSVSALGVNFMRHLISANSITFNLQTLEVVPLADHFPCLQSASLTFNAPSLGA